MEPNIFAGQFGDMKNREIDLPHFTLSGLNSQFPCAEHAPTMSPERQLSPHVFPPQPCSEHGFSSALTQNPTPSQTPSPKSGFLQANPHSIPLHVRTYKVGTKVERRKIFSKCNPFQSGNPISRFRKRLEIRMYAYSACWHIARMHQMEHHILNHHHKVHKSLICLIHMNLLFVSARSKLKLRVGTFQWKSRLAI